MAEITKEQVLALVPQRPPFRFIDEILELDTDHIVAATTFPEDADFYRGHFPGNPITPGVILVEAMAQAGVVALGIHLVASESGTEEVEKLVTVFTDANVEFSGAVYPGDRVVTTGRKLYFRRKKLRAEVEMRKDDGTVVCSGTLAGMGGASVNRRVVVTGLGVIAPNGNGLRDFELALRKGQSGIRYIEKLEEAKFSCRVAGAPQGVDELAEASFAEDELLVMNMSHRYASLAAVEAWTDAGLERPDREDDRVDWDAGAILGTGIGGMDTTGEKVVPLTDAGKLRRLGSSAVEQVMASGISARVSGQLALGNQVTTNSSACSTGTEAIAMGMDRIRRGQAERMLCGGAEAASHYIWAGFDAMRVLNRGSNDEPEKASRPMSASAAGFIPGAGAGVVLVESLESATARGTRIYAEVKGAAINCGGHRGGGSMTAPNPESVRRCITAALADGEVDAADVDAINGHLTATYADPREVEAWSTALGRGPESFPAIVATKSLIGHTLGAAGAIESVASLLMLNGGFLHPSINCEDVHPEIEAFDASIPHTGREVPDMRVVIKAGFGFGDVNACLVFRKWDE